MWRVRLGGVGGGGDSQVNVKGSNGQGEEGAKGDRGHWSICCCEAAVQSNVSKVSKLLFTQFSCQKHKWQLTVIYYENKFYTHWFLYIGSVPQHYHLFSHSRNPLSLVQNHHCLTKKPSVVWSNLFYIAVSTNNYIKHYYCGLIMYVKQVLTSSPMTDIMIILDKTKRLWGNWQRSTCISSHWLCL